MKAAFVFSIKLIAAIFMTNSYAQDGIAYQTMPNLLDLKKIVQKIETGYGNGQVQTPIAAEEALQLAEHTQTVIETWFVQAQSDCYQHFFTTACLDEVKLSRRSLQETLKQIAAEARLFQRKDRLKPIGETSAQPNQTPRK